MSYEQLRSIVKSEPVPPLKNMEKIYIKEHYLFINELEQGIHVIDNVNPSSPYPVGFINIPGNIDIAAAGNVLYADSYVDLLALDISNLAEVNVSKRVENSLSPRYYVPCYFSDTLSGVIVSWTEKMITQEIEADCQGGNSWWELSEIFFNDVANTAGDIYPLSGDSSGCTLAPGKDGSLARFAFSHLTLYTVDQSSLRIFDISNLSDPILLGTSYIGRDTETIFPYKYL